MTHQPQGRARAARPATADGAANGSLSAPSETDPAQGASLLINEVQLLLAEKRTSLAALRTGIAVLVLPLSVLSFLIVTSRQYTAIHVLHFLVPVLLLSTGLALLGTYLIVRAIIRIRRYDQLIAERRSRSAVVARLVD